MRNISFSDFQKLDIRIGTVLSAEVPKWSRWVMKMTVDFGDPPVGGGKKTSFAGIMKFFKPEELVGRQFPFILNIEPKKVGPEGEVSECMMLMAVPSHEATDGKAVPRDDLPAQAGEKTSPVLLTPEKKVENGTRVF